MKTQPKLAASFHWPNLQNYLSRYVEDLHRVPLLASMGGHPRLLHHIFSYRFVHQVLNFFSFFPYCFCEAWSPSTFISLSSGYCGKDAARLLVPKCHRSYVIFSQVPPYALHSAWFCRCPAPTFLHSTRHRLSFYNIIAPSSHQCVLSLQLVAARNDGGVDIFSRVASHV